MKLELPENSGYYYELNKSNDTFNVITKKSTPDRFVKFYSLSNYNIDALVNNYIYASHPLELNDPFDCYRGYMKFNTMFDDTVWTILFSKIGVYSMSDGKNWNQPLMWGHYCNYEGFSVILNTKKFGFKFHGPFPINYLEQIPDNIDFKENELQYIFYCTVKSNVWQYEDEWRIMPQSDEFMESPINISGFNKKLVPRKFNYPIRAVEEVILGFNFFFKDKSFDKIDENYEMTLKNLDDSKVQLLNFLVNNGIKTSIISFGTINTFEIVKKEVLIKKLNDNSFGFKINYFG